MEGKTITKLGIASILFVMSISLLNIIWNLYQKDYYDIASTLMLDLIILYTYLKKW